MDFVVFGFGVGALLMLAGFGLRDLGPWLFGNTPEAYALPEFEDAKKTIRKQTLASVGNAISAAGAGVALVTIAALLGKTTDRIGAIVVGVSLVLATVGVGAWCYDILRRYRAAMEIVTAQEQSVRTRIQAREARDRAMRPQPKPATKKVAKAAVAEKPVEEAVEPPAPYENFEDVEYDLDAPLPDWHDEPRAFDAPEPPEEDGPDFADDSDDDDAAAVVTPVDELEEITPAPVAATTTPTTSTTAVPRATSTTSTTAAPRTTPTPATTTTAAPIVRTTAAPRTTAPPATTTAMPMDDALIDESVRIEPGNSRLGSTRNAPSWLFDDLETDLERQGSTQDDPIDQFRDAKPVSRPSALERLLAEDRAKRGKSGEDDSEE